MSSSTARLDPSPAPLSALFSRSGAPPSGPPAGVAVTGSRARDRPVVSPEVASSVAGARPLPRRGTGSPDGARDCRLRGTGSSDGPRGGRALGRAGRRPLRDCSVRAREVGRAEGCRSAVSPGDGRERVAPWPASEPRLRPGAVLRVFSPAGRPVRREGAPDPAGPERRGRSPSTGGCARPPLATARPRPSSKGGRDRPPSPDRPDEGRARPPSAGERDRPPPVAARARSPPAAGAARPPPVAGRPRPPPVAGVARSPCLAGRVRRWAAGRRAGVMAAPGGRAGRRPREGGP
jgi:hypothetical protein